MGKKGREEGSQAPVNKESGEVVLSIIILIIIIVFIVFIVLIVLIVLIARINFIVVIERRMSNG